MKVRNFAFAGELRSQIGFTIVEMVVSLAILISILLISYVNFQVGNQSNNLRIARDVLINDIRKMQTYSFTGRRCQNSDSSVCSSNVLPYGLHITRCATPPCPYLLFVDANKNNLYDTLPNEALSFGSQNVSSKVEVDLQIRYSGSGYSAYPTVDLVFEPYAGRLTILNQPSIKKTKFILKNSAGTLEFIVDKESGSIIETPAGGEALNANVNGNTN